MKASIVIIGNEILLGRVTDTNSGYIARALDAESIPVTSIRTVGDDGASISSAVASALADADIVITTGGLGPTKDDITKGVLTDIFGGEMTRDDSVTENIKKIFAGRGLRLNTLTFDQALVPTSAHIIQNRFGTAPIMAFERDGKSLIAMPGVPYETVGMLPEVVEYITSRVAGRKDIAHYTYVLTGISESALAQHLDSYEQHLPEGFSLAYLPDSPIIKLRLDGPAGPGFEGKRQELLQDLRAIEDVKILATGEKTLGRIMLEALESRGMTMSTAESCTGGNLAHTITAEAGSSTVFNGGAVTYANSAKANILGVNPEDIEQFGAVSERVVRAMAEGARRAFHTDCAVATSGIAGPGGGTDDKPVGTVWIAVSTPKGTVAKCHHFPGNRERVIARATAMALITLLGQLD